MLPMNSDQLLRRGGLETLLGHLRKVKSRGMGLKSQQLKSGGSISQIVSPALRNQHINPPQVIIIGGSHSAWSCARMLLDGRYASSSNGGGDTKYKSDSESNHEKKKENTISSNLTTVINQNITLDGYRPSSNGTGVEHRGSSTSRRNGSNRVDRGGGRNNDNNTTRSWNSDTATSGALNSSSATNTGFTSFQRNANWAGRGDVLMLHRSPIKVWFKNEEHANKERKDINMLWEEIREITLEDRIPGLPGTTVNPISGLRGDAKDLWVDVRSKHETRLELRRYSSTIELHSILERKRPSVVIWVGLYLFLDPNTAAIDTY